jgi:hypothetical protein
VRGAAWRVDVRGEQEIATLTAGATRGCVGRGTYAALCAASSPRTLASSGSEGQDVGFAVIDKGSYVGHRTVHLRAYASPKADGEVDGRIYGLVR